MIFFFYTCLNSSDYLQNIPYTYFCSASNTDQLNGLFAKSLLKIKCHVSHSNVASDRLHSPGVPLPAGRSVCSQGSSMRRRLLLF